MHGITASHANHVLSCLCYEHYLGVVVVVVMEAWPATGAVGVTALGAAGLAPPPNPEKTLTMV